MVDLSAKVVVEKAPIKFGERGGTAAGLDTPGWRGYPLASGTALGGTHASLDG